MYNKTIRIVSSANLAGDDVAGLYIRIYEGVCILCTRIIYVSIRNTHIYAYQQCIYICICIYVITYI